jgi:alpha-beta hydrolase superfamily lysophospholipase
MMRCSPRFLSLFILIFVAASGAPAIAPHGTENDKPTILPDAFLTRDGLRLPLRRWEAVKPRAIIVALHGMSDYSNAFDMPASWWAQQGITTLAYDQRSFGRAPNGGIWPGGDKLRADLADFVDAVHEQYRGLPVFALGESMGGAVVLSSLAGQRPPRADGVILVAPAVWSRGDMPLSYRVALWTVTHTFPAMTLSGRGLNIWPSDNIPMLRKLARDPLFQHKTRADAVYGLVSLMDEGRHAPEHLESAPPILLLYGKNDQVIPKAPTEAVVSTLAGRADIRCYDHGYHMLLRDLEGPQVWQDVLDWVQGHRPNAIAAAHGALEVSAKLKVNQDRRSDHGLALGREGQTSKFASGRTDGCLHAGDEREIVGQ